jgi:hypothetical protein
MIQVCDIIDHSRNVVILGADDAASAFAAKASPRNSCCWSRALPERESRAKSDWSP